MLHGTHSVPYPDPRPLRLRLLSYNIHKGVGGHDRRYRLERILEVIDHERADLVCLQEVAHGAWRSRHHDQAHLLKTHCCLPDWLYQMNVHWKVGGYGNLLLSRWPLLSKHQVSLSMLTKKPRGAQLVVIETPFGLLHLVHWHLGLAERERHWQVEQLLTHRLFRETDHLPTLIVGDFNDWRNTLAGKLLAQRGLVQATAPIARFRSFPAWMPIGSLDKVFCCSRIHISHVRVVRSRVTRRASDHLPLVVDFELK